MSILSEIVEKRKERLATRRADLPLSGIKSRCSSAAPLRDFAGAIKRTSPSDPIRLIAELKKASPSRGLIRPDFDPASIARIYDERVSAISVLTEEDFFMGDIGFIEIVKSASTRPALRKDFILDEYQIYEARAFGADAILLIDAILSLDQADEYRQLAGSLGMAVLYEVHDYAELEHALRLGMPVIGVNNRNLKTMKIDLETTFRLKTEIPADRVMVSESGISSHEDVVRLEKAQVDAMLVGTSIMCSPDIAQAIDALRGR